jgi:hypothetical protein
MATYDYYREHQSPMNAPCGNSAFWLYAKVDYGKQNMGINDDLKLFKVKDKWLLLRGFCRNLVASGVASTIDLGTAQNGTELDAAFNTNSASDWTIMDTLKGGGEIALTADGYIWADNNVAAATSGEFEVMIEVYAGPYDAEGTDSLTED